MKDAVPRETSREKFKRLFEEIGTGSGKLKELDKLIPFTHLIDEFKGGPSLLLQPG